VSWFGATTLSITTTSTTILIMMVHNNGFWDNATEYYGAQNKYTLL
jgi:hypothetical protein